MKNIYIELKYKLLLKLIINIMNNKEKENKFHNRIEKYLEIFNEYQFNKDSFTSYLINFGYEVVMKNYLSLFLVKYKTKNNKKKFIKNFNPDMVIHLVALNVKINEKFYVYIPEIERKLKNGFILIIIGELNLEYDAKLAEIVKPENINKIFYKENQKSFLNICNNFFKNLDDSNISNFEEFLNEETFDNFINQLTFRQVFNLYNLLLTDLRILIINNFFPTINALKLTKGDERYKNIKDFNKTELEEYNNKLVLNITNIFLSNIINFRNLISHNKSFFDFSITDLSELEKYLKGEKNDIFLLIKMVTYLSTFNRIEFEVITMDLFSYILKNYYYFKNWDHTEAEKIILSKYAIADISYYCLENNKKLFEMLSLYSPNQIFSAVSILKNQFDLEKMTIEEIWDELLNFFKVGNDI